MNNKRIIAILSSITILATTLEYFPSFSQNVKAASIKNENESIATKEEQPVKDTIEKNEIVLEKETKENIDSKLQNEIKENNEKEKIININSSKDEKENGKELKINNNDDKKEEIKNPLPEYYKDFIKVKLEYGLAWIHKSRVEKIITLEEKEKNKDKK